MDRDLEALERIPASTWRRVGLAGVGASLIVLVSALFIRTCPIEGYRAGYDAAITQGRAWVEAYVNAEGTSLRACEELHLQSGDVLADDYSDYVEGCSDAVDALSGRHVPVLADRDDRSVHQ